jgi:hypothetical protein
LGSVVYTPTHLHTLHTLHTYTDACLTSTPAAGCFAATPGSLCEARSRVFLTSAWAFSAAARSAALLPSNRPKSGNPSTGPSISTRLSLSPPPPSFVGVATAGSARFGNESSATVPSARKYWNPWRWLSTSPGTALWIPPTSPCACCPRARHAEHV